MPSHHLEYHHFLSSVILLAALEPSLANVIQYIPIPRLSKVCQFSLQVQMSPRHGESVEVSTALSMGSRCCLDRCPCLPHGSTDLHRSPLDQSFGMTLNKEQHRTSCACQVTKWKGKRSSCLAQRLPHPSTYNNHHVSFKHAGQTV